MAVVAVSDSGGRERAIKIANECISEVPVMVLGSGASCAYGIRGMGPLSTYLVENIAPAPVDSDTWDAFKRELAVNCDLEEALQRITVSETLLRQIVTCTQRMIVEDEIKVYNDLVAGSTVLSLSQLIRYLFRTTHRVLNVVTTNYDRLAEYAACQARFRCNTGFSDGAIRHFSCQRSDPAHYVKLNNFRCVDVWKVHGSVDWYQDGSARPIGLMDSVTLPDGFAPLIVTPGIAKYAVTHQEPFRSVISCADQALSSARGFICIGYGFADSHIEPKLMQRSDDFRTPVVILARTLRPGARTFLSEHMHSKVVAFERADNGTIAYTEESPDGLLLEGEALWSLEGLLESLGVR